MQKSSTFVFHILYYVHRIGTPPWEKTLVQAVRYKQDSTNRNKLNSSEVGTFQAPLDKATCESNAKRFYEHFHVVLFISFRHKKVVSNRFYLISELLLKVAETISDLTWTA